MININVSTIDVGNLLARLGRGYAFVGVKLDVEGAEYSIVRHLLLRHAAALCSIDLLAIEWHHHDDAAVTRLLEPLLYWIVSDAGCERPVVLPWM